jgi:hypothetical protein
MALGNFVKGCTKNTPGNGYELYIAPTGTVTAIAETSGEISTLTAAVTTFKKVQADLDTVQFTQEGAFKTSGGYTQNLIAKFSYPSTELNALVDQLVSGIACGFEIIWVDANSKVWIAGVSVDSKEGSNRPFNQLATSLDSGLLMTDEGVNADTLTLTRLSGYRPTELDATLTAAVLGGTSAYIDW